MSKSLAPIALLAWALSSVPVLAEQSADDRAFAAALQARLQALEIERQNCGRPLGDAAVDRFRTIDRVERSSRASAQGGTTIGERADLSRTKRDLDSAIDCNYDCIKTVESERARITAMLSDPERAHSESERLRNELRSELLGLLADVRAASTLLSAGTSYDDYAVKMGAVATRLQSIRTKYAIPLSRGDHKSLGAPISDSCSALYAALGDWKQVRQTAKEAASAQAAMGRAATWETDFYQRQLRAAQFRHADAQRRFADRRGSALALVQAATRVADIEQSKTVQPVTVKK